MPTRVATEPFAQIPDEVLVALRDRMAAAGYDEGLIAIAERVAPGQLDRVRVPLVVAALEHRGDAAGVFARVFSYQAAVDRDELERTIGAHVFAAIDRAGWLVGDGSVVRSLVRIMPFYGLWIASDECAAQADPVAGPGATTSVLARAIAFEGIASLLDVGCGAGSLALLAKSRGVATVLGVDLDPRAIAFSELNARLNGLQVEWAAGDLTAPAAGRRFAAVVSQPPFVTHPEGVESTTFLHGGQRGDELTMRMLGELDGVLGPQGRAWVFFESSTEPTALRDRVRAALGLDDAHVVMIVGAGHTPDTLAIGYSSITEPALDDRYARLVCRYRAHLEALGIGATKQVLLHVERAQPGTRPYTVALDPPTLAGFDADGLDDLRRTMTVVALPDDALLRQPIRPARGAWLHHEQSLHEPERRRLRLRFEFGRGIEQELGDTAALLLGTLREHDTLAAAIAAHAEAMEADGPGELEAVTRDTLAFVRRGLVMGLIEPGTRT